MSDDLLLTILDLLDLDESLVDERIKYLMLKKDPTTKNLKLLMHLLNYKHLINLKESSECDNNKECEFIARSLTTVCKENIDIVCNITTCILLLQPSSLCSTSEHFLQQILADIGESLEQHDDNKYQHIFFKLKFVTSILKAACQIKVKVNLQFLEFHPDPLLFIDNEQIRNYFLFNTIPSFVENVIGYNILDKIWESVLVQYTKKDVTLLILSALSQYYIPVQNKESDVKYESTIIKKPMFWNIILFGLHSDNQFTRRSSIYLAKRAIDLCILNKIYIDINSTQIVSHLSLSKQNLFKEIWVNYFILLESLEEKQSNIVLPSLQLFNIVSDIGQKWLNPALKLGLCHDNITVRQKCLNHRLKHNIETRDDTLVLLNSLNNNYMCEDIETKSKLIDFFSNKSNFKQLIHTFSTISWSAIALYHMTEIISNININNIFEVISEAEFTENICLIIQNSCNNIVIREWVQYKIVTFVCKSCKYLQWMNFLKIINRIHINNEENKKILVPVTDWLKSLDVLDDERLKLLNYFTNSYVYVDITVLYLNLFENDLEYFNECLTYKLSQINDIQTRQYANKLECFNDFVYVMFLFEASKKQKENMNTNIFTNMALYVQSLLTNEVGLNINQLKLFSRCCSCLFSSLENEDVLLQLYKYSFVVLKEEGTFNKKIIALTIIKNLTLNKILTSNQKHEMFTIDILLEISANATSKVVNDNETVGRNLNRFYEDSCEILYRLVAIEDIKESKLKLIVRYMEHVVDCGGYGCLKWILRTMNSILPVILHNSMKINFDIIKFIERSWREVEELKSNNEFLICIQEFICIITNKALVNVASFDNVLLHYTSKIIDYASLSNAPLYFFTQRFYLVHINLESETLIYILCDILLFCPVIRKDQRTLDVIVKSILSNYDDGHVYNSYHFNYEIKNLAVSKLLTIRNQEIFNTITLRITSKISEIFKNKLRYHEHSQLHLLLSTTLQHLLFIFLMRSQTMNFENIVLWCIEVFAKIPHQNDVKFYFEWLITLYLIKKQTLNSKCLETINFDKIPAISKQMILYFYMRHKGSEGPCEFVLDYLLPHTMGQMFNIRLTAQYLSLKLFKSLKSQMDLSKYNHTMLLLENNFKENCQEKNYIKLQTHYLVNNFDAVYFLKPEVIYHFLPQHFDGSSQEIFGLDNFLSKEECDEYSLKYGIKGDSLNLNASLSENFNIEKSLMSQEFSKKTLSSEEAAASSTTIQKKYIPWNNMSDIQTYDINKMKENKGEFILVASLIEKLPNLGGMARTSEVFGVHTYVVDSLRHLQDKQFQGLSVSAERWVNIEEVRPGRPLRDYLISKKDEGYCLVGAEQTSTSVSLQGFMFPVKTLLLLGHEKEGIPCDLLPILDHCVEIPQRGVVRSLNVHVTAAIFVWEYVRQNVL